MKFGLKSILLSAVCAVALAGTAQAQDIYARVADANAQLAAQGKNYRIEMAETITSLEADEVGATILFNTRGNRQLGHDFVPGDPRRAALGTGDPGTNITFAVDNTQLTDDIAGTGELDEIRAAMATWDNVTCSTIPLTDRGNTGVDVGIVQDQLGFGGTGGVAADIQHAGFLPPEFFELLGSSNILGVTFTFVFVNAGVPTDIDNNNASDVAFREIYYNDGFFWEVDPNDQPRDGRSDLQTVALHEAGHGLSQAHFGRGVINNQTGRIQLSPQAVMNAGYIFGQQTLLGTDNAGHCSNWAGWPNN